MTERSAMHARKSYWAILKEDILQNKQLVFFALFTGILCFGFTITNFSIGIDDSARNYYLYTKNAGSMIQQGRLLHILINELTHTVEFIPFFQDFVAAALYVLSALLFCGLFQYITAGRLSLSALAAFACCYISSSILAEKFIYQLDVVAIMVSYCCVAIALMYACRFVKEGKLTVLVLAVAVLMVGISSYESFMFLYVCGVFGIFLLEMVLCDAKYTLRSLLLDGIKYALILFAAMLIYYALVALLQIATGQYGLFQRAAHSWPEGLSPLGIVLFLSDRIFQFILNALRVRYWPILIFCLFTAVGGVLSFLLSLRKKNPYILLCFAALWAGNLLIHYAGENFTSRAAQTFCFFTGFVVLLLLESFRKFPVCRKLLCLAVVLLVYVQSADMNRWFYNDYVRYQKEAFAIHTIAQKVASDFDASKPVVFTNSPYYGALDISLYEGRQVNGNSMLYWMGYAFDDKNQVHVDEVFRMHGYDFIQSPSPEQYDRAQEAGDQMPAWPQAGCIQEFEDFIVVNFG